MDAPKTVVDCKEGKSVLPGNPLEVKNVVAFGYQIPQQITVVVRALG